MSDNFQTSGFIENCAKGHRLHGRVKFCPFCGTPVALPEIESVELRAKVQPTVPSPVTTRPATAQNTTKISDTINEPEPKSVVVTTVAPVPIIELPPKRPVAPVPPSEPKTPVKGLKYTFFAILITAVILSVAIVAYENSIKQPRPAQPVDVEIETVIRAAIEEMKLTGQSLFKEKQMKKNLENAREALAISESYRETVNQIELANVNTIQKTKKQLSEYLKKVEWLSHHSEQFSSAIKAYAVANPKDTFMVDLLKQHVASFSSNKDMSEDAWKLELEPVSIQLGL